ncbi:MAG: tetratricopeptide repeat protein, partial [Rhodanobacter sp.]
MKMGRLRAVLLLLLVPAFAGCVAQQTKPQQIAPSYDQLMKQAYARYEAKDLDGAKALYSKASSADPTRTDPWYRLAQINFDQQNYGHAIVDAQEVLQRNSADTNAKNILTIAGLRVAVEALGRLHEDADQTGP